MRAYLNALERVFRTGRFRKSGHNDQAPTWSVFQHTMQFDLREGFPLLTTKKIPFRLVIEELLWFLRGSTDARELQAVKCHIWDKWALTKDDVEDVYKCDPSLEGSIGPLYGAMWRSWPTTDGGQIDQITDVMEGLKYRPMSRRHIVSVWNPELLPKEYLSPKRNVAEGRQALAPCHPFFQFYAEPLMLHERMAILYDQEFTSLDFATKSDEEITALMQRLDLSEVPVYRLDMAMYARSQDLPIGTPFNIASYAALLMMFAQQLNMVPGIYTHLMGDAHIYDGQMPLIADQLKRTPKPLPKLFLVDKPESIFDYKWENFKLVGYHPDAHIPYPVYE